MDVDSNRSHPFRLIAILVLRWYSTGDGGRVGIGSVAGDGSGGGFAGLRGASTKGGIQIAQPISNFSPKHNTGSRPTSLATKQHGQG